MFCPAAWSHNRPFFLRRGRVRVLMAAALAACSGSGDGSTNVDVPPLQIMTATSGTSIDPDGYSATIDAGAPMAIGVNDTVVVGDAGSGRHVVTLSGVASNCQVQGNATDTVTVADGSTADASFEVTCGSVSAGDGQIQVTTATIGSNPDPDGYAILLDGNRVGSIPSAGAATIGGIPAGSHGIGLDSLAEGCQVSGDNPQTLTVVADSTIAAAFAVDCGSTPTRQYRTMDRGSAAEQRASLRHLGKRTDRFLCRRNRPEQCQRRRDRAL